MTETHFAPLSLKASLGGPEVLPGSPGHVTQMRLRCDGALGLPLLVGLVPAAQLGQAEASGHTRYALWQRLGEHPDEPLMAQLTLDVAEPLATNALWLVYLVCGQHPDLEQSAGLIDLPPLPHTFCDLATLAEHYLRQYRPDQAPDPHWVQSLIQSVQKAEHAQLTARDQWPGSAFITLPPTLATDGHESTPARQTERVRLLLGSCQYPAGILDRSPHTGTWSPGPADAALTVIARLRRSPLAPDALLLVGDQVYVDATAGLFDPTPGSDGHSATYRQRMESRWSQAALLGQTPVHTMLDDHEIADNWGPVNPQATGLLNNGERVRVQPYNDQLLAQGLKGYWASQGPASVVKPLGATQPLWRTVGTAQHPNLVFLADTRTERSLRNSHTLDQATIMGEVQFGSICAWLQQGPPERPRIVACPSMVLPRTRAVAQGGPASARLSDAWNGYPNSLHRLLATLHSLQLPHVLLLSGDEHLASYTRITLTRAGSSHTAVAHVVHTPGLYAPFPFANAEARDFSNPDAFDFTINTPGLGAATYNCHTQSWFPGAGDGCVLIDVPITVSATTPVLVHFVYADGRTAAVPDWAQDDPCLQLSLLGAPR
jgi:hypothetical protein